MRALTWAGGHDVVVADVPDPTPASHDVLVEVAYTGLCGTDLHICAGDHPRALPGIVIGHEMSGTVRSVGGAVSGIVAGTKVVVDPLLPCGQCRACRGRHPEVCVRLRLLGIDVPGGGAPLVAVAADHLVPVPDEADLRRLAFAEPLGVAVRAVRRSGLALGEDVIVLGAGPIGLAVAWCARMAGAATVTVAEPSPARQGFAAQMGFDVCESIGDRQADVVFDAAGHPSVAALLTSATAPGGRAVVVAVYGSPAPVDLRAITFAELTVIGTRVYSPGDLRAATDLIAAGTFDPEPFFTSTVSLTDAPQAIDELRAGRGVKVLVQPTETSS